MLLSGFYSSQKYLINVIILSKIHIVSLTEIIAFTVLNAYIMVK